MISTTRGDFAIFFESIPEFSGEKLPLGTSVVLVGDKVRPANEGEEPIGVVSATSIMIGNLGGVDAGTAWGGKYKTDDYGRFITTEVDCWSIQQDEISGEAKKTIRGIVIDGIAPKGSKIKKAKLKTMSEDYRKDEKYISRTERSEWNVVALIGIVKLKSDQPTAKRWTKLRRINAEVEEWLIR